MQAVVSEVMATLPGGSGIQTVQPVNGNQPSKNKTGVFANTLKAKIVDCQETSETTEPAVADTDINTAVVFGLPVIPGGLTLTPVTNDDTDQFTAGMNEITELTNGDSQQAITEVTPESSKVSLSFADLMTNQNTASEPAIAVQNQADGEQLVAANLTVENPVAKIVIPDTYMGPISAVSAGGAGQPPVSDQTAITASAADSEMGLKDVLVVNAATSKATPDNTIAVAAAPEIITETITPDNSLNTKTVNKGTEMVTEPDASAIQAPAAKVDTQIIPPTAILSAVVKLDRNLTQNVTDSSELPVSTQTSQDLIPVNSQTTAEVQTSTASQETIPTVLPPATPNNSETDLAASDNETGRSAMPTAELKDSDDQLTAGEGSDITEGTSTKTDTASDYALLFKLQQTAQNRILKKPAVSPQENIKNVIQRLEIMLNDNIAQAKMVLKPEHLGQLTIRMDVQDGVLNAKFIVDTQQAKAMLETNLTAFRQQLEQSGVRVEKVEVTINQPGNDGSQFFNQSQYRPPGQGSYQQPGFSYYSRQDSYGSGDYDYLPERVPLTASSYNSVSADGVNYVV